MSLVTDVISDFRVLWQQRNRAQQEDSLSILASNEDQAFRLPLVYANNTFLLSDKAAWTGFEIPMRPWGFLRDSEVKGYFRAATSTFQNTFPSRKENAGHLLITNQVIAPEEWERGLIERHADTATPTWKAFVRASRDAVDANEFFERETYLFVRMGSRGEREGIRGHLRGLMETAMLTAGIEDTQPDTAEVDAWTESADEIADRLYSSWFQALPINRDRIEWLTRHLDSPGLPTPATTNPADPEPWGIGAWRTVLSSYTRPAQLGKHARSRYYGIEFDSPTGGGRTYAAFLPISIIPPKLAYNLHWMHHASLLPFPVDVSTRFEIIDPDRATREIQSKVNSAEAQAEEDAAAGVRSDETTRTQQESLQQIKTRTKMGREPLARWQSVLSVYDTDPGELRSKIVQLIEHYNQIHVRLENPQHDQRELFYQQFPGGEIEIHDWIHRTQVSYLGAAQPWLTSTVGDNAGVYQGYTITRDAQGRPQRGTPVFYDLLNVVDQAGEAPTEQVAAESGSGKTVSRGIKPAYEDYHRGVTQLYWDPKGDVLALVEHANWLRIDRSKIRLIDLYNSRESVSLDPFGLAEVDLSDPNDPRDDRSSTANDVLTQLFSTIVDTSANLGMMLIQTAIRRELAKEEGLTPQQVQDLRENASDRALEDEPCLAGVMQSLTEWSQDASEVVTDHGMRQQAQMQAQVMAEKMREDSRSSLGRLLFRRPSQSGSLNINPGDLVLFIAINMEPTAPGAKPTNKSLLADIISGMMADFIRSLLYRLPDEIMKSATFDEWHVIRRSGRAEHLVQWMRRMGRSKRCMVRQLSQSADDFPENERAEDVSLSTAWCGKVDTESAAKSSCRLLGLEPSESNIATLRNLGKGQFLFRDASRRVQLVQVEFVDDEMLERFNTDAQSKARMREAAKPSAARGTETAASEDSQNIT